jgi:flavin reductase like protein
VDGKTAVPILANLPANIECEVERIVDRDGDHAVVILRVVEAEFRKEVQPLTIGCPLNHTRRHSGSRHGLSNSISRGRSGASRAGRAAALASDRLYLRRGSGARLSPGRGCSAPCARAHDACAVFDARHQSFWYTAGLGDYLLGRRLISCMFILSAAPSAWGSSIAW